MSVEQYYTLKNHVFNLRHSNILKTSKTFVLKNTRWDIFVSMYTEKAQRAAHTDTAYQVLGTVIIYGRQNKGNLFLTIYIDQRVNQKTKVQKTNSFKLNVCGCGFYTPLFSNPPFSS